MKNVLLITSSPRGEASLSTKIATELASKIAEAQVTVRDLGREPLPHLDPVYLHAAYTPEADRSTAQREAIALSDNLVAELKAADIVVIGAGMINFGVPSALKSWIDYIARAGVTFRYGEQGPEGLVTGKKVILVLAAGGVYSTGPMTKMDFVEPYLRATLGFLGMTEVEAVWIEGVAFGPEASENAVASATVKATELATTYAA